MRGSRVFTWLGGYPFAIASVAAVTAALLPFRAALQPAQAMLIFVPLLVLLGRSIGLRVAIFAAVESALLLDLAFVPPYGQLTIGSASNWVSLALFIAVAVIAGAQTGRLHARERAAVRRGRELELLNRLSGRLVSEKSVETMAPFVTGALVDILGASRAALYTLGGGDAPALAAQTGEPARESEAGLVAWVLRNDKAIGLRIPGDVPFDLRPVAVPASEAVPGAGDEGAFVPLQTPDGLEGVLYVRDAGGGTDDPAAVRQMLAVANLTAAFLSRRRLEDAAAMATVLRESDRLKSTLVSSVSHELKTPLAAVTARITGLLDEPGGPAPERTRSELEAVTEDLGRLNASIGALLDLSRLESDSWQPRWEYLGLADVLGTVRARLSAPERERVAFAIEPDVPTVRADFSQLAGAVTNLVENALLYSPADSRVVVGVRAHGRDVELAVEDAGPGIPDDEKDLVFEKFYRGAASGTVPSGTGLGLAIAREIVRSHDGRIRIEDVRPHGARFVVTLPAGPGEDEL